VTNKHPNVKAYMFVFGTLLALTLVTVAVSKLQLPMAAAVFVALLVASVKAGLVATFFMHLKGEKVLIFALLLMTVFFMGHLILVPIADTSALADRMEKHEYDVTGGKTSHGPSKGAHH
jgi:cytochrome c oxidase subunit IV